MFANQYVIPRASQPLRYRFLFILPFYLVFVFSLIHTYEFQIQEENAYMGMQAWEMSFVGWFLLVVGIPFIALFVSRLRGNPSDFFIIFYSFITIISFLTLHSVNGEINDLMLFLSVSILIFPLMFVSTAKLFILRFKFDGIFDSTKIEHFICFILFLTIIYSYLNPTASAGFEVIDSYYRRLEGRGLYSDSSFSAYALAMSMNGFAPYLAFKAGVHSRIKLFFIAVFSVLFFFWLLGVKAPLFYVIMAFFLGKMIKNKVYVNNFARYLLSIIALLYFIVMVEWFFYDNHSVIADYFYRRVFTVQSELISFYMDFLFSEKSMDWNWWIGSFGNNFEATYYIGGNYLGSWEANANTNAFLYALAARGLSGYLISNIFVSLLLVLFDQLYQSSRNPTYFFLGFIYGLLVIEQAYSTAFVSSGVGALILLTLLEKSNIHISKR